MDITRPGCDLPKFRTFVFNNLHGISGIDQSALRYPRRIFHRNPLKTNFPIQTSTLHSLFPILHFPPTDFSIPPPPLSNTPSSLSELHFGRYRETSRSHNREIFVAIACSDNGTPRVNRFNPEGIYRRVHLPRTCPGLPASPFNNPSSIEHGVDNDLRIESPRRLLFAGVLVGDR